MWSQFCSSLFQELSTSVSQPKNILRRQVWLSVYPLKLGLEFKVSILFCVLTVFFYVVFLGPFFFFPPQTTLMHRHIRNSVRKAILRNCHSQFWKLTLFSQFIWCYHGLLIRPVRVTELVEDLCKCELTVETSVVCRWLIKALKYSVQVYGLNNNHFSYIKYHEIRLQTVIVLKIMVTANSPRVWDTLIFSEWINGFSCQLWVPAFLLVRK